MSEVNAVIIAGGLVVKNNKFLLVQEAKPSCYGKWNLPAGHLDVGEDIFEGAKREVREEAGCEVELTGVCQIGNRRRRDLAFTAVIFTARPLDEDIHTNQPDEILDVRWFSYEEIVAMKDDIRNTDLMLGAIENYRQGIVAPLSLVRVYQEGAEFQNVTIKD